MPNIDIECIYSSNYTNLLVEMYEIWTNSISKIKEINYDNNNGNIEFILENGPINWISSSSGYRFSIWNNYNLFTNIYQFYFDPNTKYICLPQNINPNKNQIIYPSLIEIINKQGTSINNKTKNIASKDSTHL